MFPTQKYQNFGSLAPLARNHLWVFSSFWFSGRNKVLSNLENLPYLLNRTWLMQRKEKKKNTPSFQTLKTTVLDVNSHLF